MAALLLHDFYVVAAKPKLRREGLVIAAAAVLIIPPVTTFLLLPTWAEAVERRYRLAAEEAAAGRPFCLMTEDRDRYRPAFREIMLTSTRFTIEPSEFHALEAIDAGPRHDFD